MKNSKLLLMLFLALSFSISSCDDDDDDDELTPNPPTTNSGPTQNIAEIAIASNQTDSLVVALSRAGLVTTFQSPGTYTVFAPNNQAFVNVLADLGVNAIADIPVPTLESVLLYHVMNTKVMAAALNDNTYGMSLNTNSPDNDANSIEVDVTGGVKLNNNATTAGASVTAADIEATNGVIHIIDKVIMPQTVTGLALNDERLTSLVAALSRFGSTYTDLFSDTSRTFTVFAPTNGAFQDLLNSNPSWNTLADIPQATLQTVLEYHVVDGANVQSSELQQNQTVTTITGDFTIDLRNGAQIVTGDTSQANVNIILSAADIQGTNGVVHAVDAVLLP